MSSREAEEVLAGAQPKRETRLGVVLIWDRMRRWRIPWVIGIFYALPIGIVRSADFPKYPLPFLLYAIGAIPTFAVRASLSAEEPLRNLMVIPIPMKTREFAEWLWQVHMGPLTFLAVAMLWTAGEFATSGQWRIPNLDLLLAFWIVYVVSGSIAVLNAMGNYEGRNPNTRVLKSAFVSLSCVCVLGGLFYQMTFTWADLHPHHLVALVSGTGLLALSWVFRRYMASEAGDIQDPFFGNERPGCGPLTKPAPKTTSGRLKSGLLALFALAYVWEVFSQSTPGASERLSNGVADFFFRLFSFISMAVVSREATKRLLPITVYRMLPLKTSRIVFLRILIQFAVCAALFVALVPLAYVIDPRNLLHFPIFLGYAATLCLFVICIRLWERFTLEDRQSSMVLLYPYAFLASTALAGGPGLSPFSLPTTLAVLGILIPSTLVFYHHVFTRSMDVSPDRPLLRQKRQQ